ncbi:unnamed protein product [Staurois parvus]|uniref:MHC class I antigen n=1 Tax=Staurois parvus TaxID=386267 RepID=A0ABN9FMA0_9NEOB|nr:unnamed protein product [Staurois parvus]
MAECGDGDSSIWEAVTGTHERLWTWREQHEEAGIGAHGRLGALAAAMGGHSLPAPLCQKMKHQQCEET